MACSGINGDYPRSPPRPQVENQACNFGTTVPVNWRARTSANERERARTSAKARTSANERERARTTNYFTAIPHKTHTPIIKAQMYALVQRSPTPGPRTGTGPWVIWYRAAQKE